MFKKICIFLFLSSPIFAYGKNEDLIPFYFDPHTGDIYYSEEDKATFTHDLTKDSSPDNTSNQPTLNASIDLMAFKVKNNDISFKDYVIPHQIREELETFQLLLTTSEKKLKQYCIEPEKQTNLLLHGKPGTGKTTIAKALAHKYEYDLFVVPSDSLLSSYVGETGARIGGLLRQAHEYTQQTGKKAILFLDEFDSLFPERSKVHASNYFSQAKDVNAALPHLEGKNKNLIVIAATNHLNQVDGAIKRRFKCVFIPEPDALTRKEIFEKVLARFDKKLPHNFDSIIENTKGFTGHDIHEAIRHAGLLSLKRRKKNFSYDILREVILKRRLKH